VLYSQQVVRKSLTRNNFRRIFAGSEVVVSGRTTAENLTSEVGGRSFSGNSSYSFVPTPLPPTDTNTTVSSIERLWAYLTIQQLLNKQDASGDDNATDSSCCDDDYDDSNSSYPLELALRVSTSSHVALQCHVRRLRTGRPAFEAALKRTGREAGHPPVSNAEVKNVEARPQLLHVPSVSGA
jgi:hypothetical protein